MDTTTPLPRSLLARCAFCQQQHGATNCCVAFTKQQPSRRPKPAGAPARLPAAGGNGDERPPSAPTPAGKEARAARSPHRKKGQPLPSCASRRWEAIVVTEIYSSSSRSCCPAGIIAAPHLLLGGFTEDVKVPSEKGLACPGPGCHVLPSAQSWPARLNNLMKLFTIC